MPNKLNDVQITELVMKHANGTSISALAREYKVSRTSITRYLKENAEIEQKCASIKNETITEWIKNNSNDLAGLLDEIKTALRRKIKGASVKELFGGLKILTDLGLNVKDVFDDPNKDEKGIKFEFVDTSIEGVNNE